jgi:aryl-alcohol dehydrogenase-like predicted oxidoreductase
MYNLLARNIEAELLPMARKHQVSTFVYNPLAGGLLTGKHLIDQAILNKTIFGKNGLYENITE